MSLLYLNSWFKLLLKRQKKLSSPEKSSGFTLIELLITIILGSVLVAALMSLVVELLTTDARETARTETEREMNMALDYISRDVREAVYVYDGACLADVDVPERTQGVQEICSGLGANLQKINKIEDPKTPILAFWKFEDLPENVDCRAGGKENVPCLAGRSYSLVVYFLVKNSEEGPWKGLARIERYELPRYSSNGSENYTKKLDPNGQDVGFTDWPGSAAPRYEKGTSATLVDFVDRRPLNDANLKDALGGEELSVDCPKKYVLTPHDNTLRDSGFENVRNFYACVKVPENLQADEPDEEEAGAFNQKVILFVRGNASGKPGIKTANEGYMPAIATQVLNRGVKDKVPK